MKRVETIAFYLAVICFFLSTPSKSVLFMSAQRQSSLLPSLLKTPSSRRDAIGILATAAGISLLPSNAYAIKERNEALCGTGFFTNIAQYYCTDIGNISDEGNVKDLTSSQAETTDSLMSKLGIDTDFEEDIGQSNSKDTSGKSNEEAKRSVLKSKDVNSK
mmetsp:Transcript_28588/g.42269  ORF Transcript_28588/g.42269 Transcript_28588/m.42269 type:complete len:161 (-) Transcript_28588:309-791(-)